MRPKLMDHTSCKAGTASPKTSLHVASASLCFGVLPARTTTVSLGSKSTALTATRSCGFKPRVDDHDLGTTFDPILAEFQEAESTEPTDSVSSTAGLGAPGFAAADEAEATAADAAAADEVTAADEATAADEVTDAEAHQARSFRDLQGMGWEPLDFVVQHREIIFVLSSSGANGNIAHWLKIQCSDAHEIARLEALPKGRVHCPGLGSGHRPFVGPCRLACCRYAGPRNVSIHGFVRSASGAKAAGAGKQGRVPGRSRRVNPPPSLPSQPLRSPAELAACSL